MNQKMKAAVKALKTARTHSLTRTPPEGVSRVPKLDKGKVGRIVARVLASIPERCAEARLSKKNFVDVFSFSADDDSLHQGNYAAGNRLERELQDAGFDARLELLENDMSDPDWGYFRTATYVLRVWLKSSSRSPDFTR